MRSKEARAAICIFLAAATVLLALHANRAIATNDEGMILEPAQRMLSGARPYVDFFSYMSPGSYWLQALVFWIFGVSLWAGRLIVIFDFSLQCALVFWLTARLASRRAGWVAMLMFAGFQIADPSLLTAQHRWDSATLALAGLAFAVQCVLDGSTSLRWVAAGALLAAAAWCTPAIALVGAAVALFILFYQRRNLIPFAGGALAISLVSLLLLGGSLASFIHQMAWLRTNYSAVNVMPYGAIIGGYGALFQGGAGFAGTAVQAVLVACLALPAILPILGLAGALVASRTMSGRQRAATRLAMFALVAFVATVFPRADVAHLAFVAALPFVLATAAFAHLLPARIGAWLAMFMLVLAAVFSANFFNTLRATTAVPSQVGTLRVPSADAKSMQDLIGHVRPGDGLFVYPYMPIHYFLTQAKNPTQFSFLAPGMMTDREASVALAEIEARPPQWLLYLKLSREEFLRVFPHGANLKWRFEALENWLEDNYEPLEPAVSVSGYRLWQRSAAPHSGPGPSRAGLISPR
jgi:4-amino-4-deoxy-L-arabinose transferase-like glycosyltransferase